MSGSRNYTFFFSSLPTGKAREPSLSSPPNSALIDPNSCLNPLPGSISGLLQSKLVIPMALQYVHITQGLCCCLIISLCVLPFIRWGALPGICSLSLPDCPACERAPFIHSTLQMNNQQDSVGSRSKLMVTFQVWLGELHEEKPLKAKLVLGEDINIVNMRHLRSMWNKQVESPTARGLPMWESSLWGGDFYS